MTMKAPTAQILLVGPDNPSRAILARVLAGGGYGVEACPPEEFSSRAAEPRPDLVVLLPQGPRGLEFLRELRSRPSLDGVPILVAFSQFTEAGAAQALEMGGDEFILPPFEPNEVLPRVAVMLRLRQDRQLLKASQEEFTRLFKETHHPLFLCDRGGAVCRVNPALARLLGYHRDQEILLPDAESRLFQSSADRERFHQLLARPESVRHAKINLKSREGRPVPVLLRGLTPPASSGGPMGFQVRPVGDTSSLKKAIHGIVEAFLPRARDYLSLLELTPLLGGRYEQLKKLGQGSFGEVWLIQDTETLGPARHYVAKIPLDRAANPKFRKEAAICQRLAPHPGVVELVGTLEDAGRFVLIQEYVPGKTLQDLLTEELPRPLVENILLQLIDVVAQAHRHRIIHRDIKPGNIIIRPDGVLKLLDYGAAKILKDKDIGATMVGSRPFMAPEQIMGKSELKSDIWAIGVIMYLLYTGELPFYIEVEKMLIDQILEQEPAPPREVNPEIPEALETIILKCLKKKAEERYPTARALKADLLRHFPHYGSLQGGWPWIP
jgi:PAS domain S-box-containing protein